jgi:hypothetical protein
MGLAIRMLILNRLKWNKNTIIAGSLLIGSIGVLEYASLHAFNEHFYVGALIGIVCSVSFIFGFFLGLLGF